MTEANNNQQSIEVGGKFPLKLKGRNGFVWALALGLLVLVAFLVRFNLGLWGEPFPIKDMINTYHDAEEKQHEKIVEKADESTYVLSVCLNMNRKAECDQLNLQMPDSLRKRQR